ncbi:MAG: phosphopantetheine-binding protein [Mycoplasmataceae bacterium]|jgi:acyl carrier protein|nr:phosphopantetheine-binding protein [Mycoplasmataceae bacterium]
MTREQIISHFKDALIENDITTSFESIKSSKSLKESGIDSIQAMSIIVSMEEKLNVRIDDEKLKNLSDFNSLIALFEEIA